MVKYLDSVLTAIRWYDPNTSAEEKKLLYKLDILILTYTSLSFFTKFLDVSALNNAYVSGMKEDINMNGNDLNYVNAVYESCYCVFQIPINLLLTKYSSSFVLPFSEFAWGIATLGTAFVENVHQLMATRALLGLFAASNYVGSVFIISSWYKKSERAKRMTLFWIANPIGTAVGGFLQAAIYTNQNLALQSWRILFIVCSSLTVFVSFYGFVALPNLPHDIRSRFLTSEEKLLAVTRLENENIESQRKLNWKSLKTLSLNWQAPLFSFLMFAHIFAKYPTSTPFTLWLKSRDYLSVTQVNNIPTAGNAISLVSALTLGWYSDIFQDRFKPFLACVSIEIIGNGILTANSTSDVGKYVAFFLLFSAHGAAPIWQIWVSDLTSHDSELRAYSIAAGNVAGEVGYLVVPLIVYQVVQAPRFKAGFIFSLVISIAELFTIIVIFILGKKLLAKHNGGLETIADAESEGHVDEKSVIDVAVEPLSKI